MHGYIVNFADRYSGYSGNSNPLFVVAFLGATGCVLSTLPPRMRPSFNYLNFVSFTFYNLTSISIPRQAFN